MKAASKSQGPKRWRREEHLGLAGEGSGVGWSGKVPNKYMSFSFVLDLFQQISFLTNCGVTWIDTNNNSCYVASPFNSWSRIPVTAERTKAEVEAMKLGPMDGGRELRKNKWVILWMMSVVWNTKETDTWSESKIIDLVWSVFAPWCIGWSRRCRCRPAEADEMGGTWQTWNKLSSSARLFILFHVYWGSQMNKNNKGMHYG